MIVFPSEDKKSICVQDMQVQPDGTITIEEAAALANGLVDAIQQCDRELKITVQVPKHQPTQAQLIAAVARVSHIRRSMQDRPWNDVKTNTELVMRVLEACL